MYITCLDMEGVLTPEIWIEFANATGIPGLARTTRDEPDYDKLMRGRLALLSEHGLGIAEIQKTIATIDPLPGAREFLDRVRRFGQCIIISDTFSQFASPLMEKLNWPTIFCNELVVDDDGMIVDYHMRVTDTKLTTVRGLNACGYQTVAAGDSLNDIAMIQHSSAGWLFRTTDEIRAQYPDILALEDYDDLYNAIVAACSED